jgi:hypothetical protein
MPSPGRVNAGNFKMNEGLMLPFGYFYGLEIGDKFFQSPTVTEMRRCATEIIAL